MLIGRIDRFLKRNARQPYRGRTFSDLTITKFPTAGLVVPSDPPPTAGASNGSRGLRLSFHPEANRTEGQQDHG